MTSHPVEMGKSLSALVSVILKDLVTNHGVIPIVVPAILLVLLTFVNVNVKLRSSVLRSVITATFQEWMNGVKIDVKQAVTIYNIGVNVTENNSVRHRIQKIVFLFQHFDNTPYLLVYQLKIQLFIVFNET